MLTLLYCIVWVLIGLILGRLGLSISSLEFWIIILSVVLIIMIKERLYEKELLKKMEKYKDGA